MLDWLLPMLMNGQVKIASAEAGDVKGYEEKEEVRIASEGEDKYLKEK